ncbi:MAG: 4-hydroxy-tetrahydrodipicolinate reductase [Proteobacteria bacterium]|nr:4-hydroxy-tetrahydrodipicolinate reductase [Pseudomonadota bacterium]
MSTKKKGTKTNLWIQGREGRMGSEIETILENSPELNFELSDKFVTNQKSSNLVIDFSSPEGTASLLMLAKKRKDVFFLIGTTGLPEKLISQWKSVAVKQGHKVLFAQNTSLGVYTLATSIGAIAKKLVPNEFDLEIVETHHNKKKDAPSGTALLLARMIQKDVPDLKIVFGHSALRPAKSIGIHAVRGGGVFGEHEIRFIGQHEEIAIKHRAFSRKLFASGALALSQKLLTIKNPGIYTIDEI